MNNFYRISALLLAGSVLSGCFHNDDGGHAHQPNMYKVTVHNLSSNQPLTPLAAVLHKPEYVMWSEGEAASVDLEKLAEGGDATELLTTAMASSYVMNTAATANGPFGPGSSESVMLEAHDASDVRISVATMLANTNDAFTGLSGVDVSGLMHGESMTIMAPVYDAGTEANTEAAGTIPGPADAAGEGFNAARESSDFVRVHAGVVSMDDGLVTSILDESHRWQGPVTKIVIERM